MNLTSPALRHLRTTKSSANEKRSYSGRAANQTSADIRLEQARLKINVLEQESKGSNLHGQKGRILEDLREQMNTLKADNESKRKHLQTLAKQASNLKFRKNDASLIRKDIAVFFFCVVTRT